MKTMGLYLYYNNIDSLAGEIAELMTCCEFNQDIYLVFVANHYVTLVTVASFFIYVYL